MSTPPKIEVRIQKRGVVRDGIASSNATQVAFCDLCAREVDAVASTSLDGRQNFACKTCLRTRLEAMTVATWLLRDEHDTGLPWGKVSG